MVTKEKQMLKKGTKLVILFKAIKYIILLSVAHKLVFINVSSIKHYL